MKSLADKLTSLFRGEGNRPMKIKELAKRLDVPSDDYRIFRNEVRDLYGKGFLVRVKKGRYALGGMTDLVEGRIKVRRNGSAGLTGLPLESKRNYILRFNRKGAIDGDRVRVLITGKSSRDVLGGRGFGVLDRAHSMVAGYLSLGNRGRVLVRPGNPGIDREIIINGDTGVAREGELVVVDVLDWGRGSRYAHGTIREVFGDVSEEECDILSVILEHGLPLEFPPRVVE